jgi:hypothetical protein
MLWNPSGHLIVTGTAPGTNGLPVIRTTQYDGDGQESWTVQSEGGDSIHFAERLRIDATGVISVMAQSSNNLIRLFYDASGNLLSNVVFHIRPDFGASARLPTTDGGVAVAGYDGCGGWAIGRYRPDGSEYVLSAYKPRPTGYGRSITAYALDEKENFYIAGINCNTGNCMEGRNFDLIVLKYDSQARRLWGNSFRIPNVIIDFVRPIVLKFDAQSNVYMGAMSYIVKYDANGNRLWYTHTGGERLADIELGPDGDIFMAGTQSRVGTSEDFLVARWRQPVTTNVAVLTTPLVSQALRTNSTVQLGPIEIHPEPFESFPYQWLLWGSTLVPNSWVTFINPPAGEYSLRISSPGGTAYSGWMRVSYLPRLTNLTVLPEGQMSFSIVGETSAYTIEGSTDLVNWLPVTNLFFCGTAPITNVIAPAGSRFFRAARNE